MADSINIFKSSAYLLYKNPILFTLSSIGSIISIVFEAFYLVGLRNNNSQNYFLFSDIFILFLFFISFTIAYFQLILISRKIIPKRSPENKNYCYNTIIFEFLVIYSFYAITLADIGGYETEMRGKLASASTTTDHFSTYISKISIQYDNLFATIVSFGIPLVFLVSIISMFFNAWMVQYILQITTDKTKG